MNELIQLGEGAGAVIALAGALALGGRAVRSMLRIVRKLGHLADEVLGDGDKPGWGRRIAAIEQAVDGLQKTTATVAAEVKPNGGASLKDQITRIEQATGATKETP